MIRGRGNYFLRKSAEKTEREISRSSVCLRLYLRLKNIPQALLEEDFRNYYA